MQYQTVVPGRFLSRPNRFIAQVEAEGGVRTVHVKNTGRCRELLVPGAAVYLEKSANPRRRTAYDLIAVQKGGLLVNMDAQAPNRVFAEWLEPRLPEGAVLRREYAYGDSRLDFCVESPRGLFLIEVKGVTLEDGGAARFPDAPTERGVKHLEELVKARQAGYEAAVCFLIQMEGVEWFQPNDGTHPAFGAALRRARDAGVEVLALDCRVGPDFLEAGRAVEVRL